MKPEDCLRTPDEVVASAIRVAHDHALAKRLSAVGIKAYKRSSVILAVDLATEGNLIQPKGRPLVNCKLFNTQVTKEVHRWKRDIQNFEESHRPADITSITIRPPKALTKGDQRLLDESGRTPLPNLTAVLNETNKLVQGAAEEGARRGIMDPLLAVRHVRPIPESGGALYDPHVHLTASIATADLLKVQELLFAVFGCDRVWISAIANPGEKRKFSSTGLYPLANLSKVDWSVINDENLVDFYKQMSGRRTIDALGSFRAARSRSRPQSARNRADRAGSPSNSRSHDGTHVPEAVPTSTPTSITGDEGSNAAGAGLAGRIDRGCDAPPLVVLGDGYEWFGLTRRYVLFVENYTSFDELRGACNNLDGLVERAKTHAESVRQYVINLTAPANPEPAYSDEPAGPESPNRPAATNLTTPAEVVAPPCHDLDRVDVDTGLLEQAADEGHGIAGDGDGSTPEGNNTKSARIEMESIPEVEGPAISVVPDISEDTNSSAATKEEISVRQPSNPSPAGVAAAPELRLRVDLALDASGRATASATMVLPAALFFHSQGGALEVASTTSSIRPAIG